MKSGDVITRYKKDMLQGKEYADKELEENIIDYAKDKILTIITLSGIKHCDAGYLINKHKRIF